MDKRGGSQKIKKDARVTARTPSQALKLNMKSKTNYTLIMFPLNLEVKDLFELGLSGKLKLEDLNRFELQSFKNNFGGNLKQDNI